MLITAVAFTGTARMWTIGLYARSTSSDHWLSCPFEDSWYVRNVTSSDGNSSDEVFFCFYNGFIHQVTWPHVSGFLPLGAPWSSWCVKPLWKQKKTSLLELPSLLITSQTCQESSNEHDNQWSDDVLHACMQWRIRAVPVNVTAVISMLIVPSIRNCHQGPYVP